MKSVNLSSVCEMGGGGREKKTSSVVPESKPPSSPLACLICYCHTKVLNSSVMQFYGFFLDPTTEARNCDGDGDGEGFTPLSPRFRLDGLVGVQFCIANSILYVFEVCGLSDDFAKSVYSLDLSVVLNESSMVVVEKAMLEKCSEMKSSKATANAILTPKGKILVFSPHTSPFGYPGEFDFELFDPDTNQCRSLPQLPLTERLWIEGYGFLGDSLFMISTDGGKYALDLDGNNGWEEHNFRYPHTPSSYFMASGNEIYSIAGVVRIQDRHATPLARFDPPLSELPDSISCRFGPEQFDNYSSSICLLGAADKDLILCIAQAAFVDDERNDRPFILFDVYRSDSDPDLTRKRKASFRFTADIPGHLVTFISEGMFRVV